MEEAKNVGSFLNNVKKNNQFTLASREKYFVDKSGIIDILNESVGKMERFICVTRPRRFGKSINALMIASYYTKNLDMSDVFDKLKIAKCSSYKEHLNKHNVIYISFNTKNMKFNSYEEYRDFFIDGLVDDVRRICPDINPNAPISKIFDRAYYAGKRFIFVIDEWDYIFNNEMYTKDDRRNFLFFLEDLLKDKSYVELAYMTGILPIAKNSSGSSINMFKEYDFTNDAIYSKYFGFLEEEVEELCKKQDKITMQQLREWYDGYYTQEGDHIYNPRSVVYALQDGRCQSYWTKTGKMKEVSNYINANIGGVKDEILAMLSGQEIPTTLGGFDAEAKASYKEKPKEERTKDLILSGMTVLGFLSYYLPKETLEFYKTIGVEPNGRILKIPNKELKLEFERIITSGDVGGLAEIITDSKDMLQATIDKDEEKMAKILEKIHKEHCSYFEYNKEIVLSFVVTTAYLYATTRYVIKKEDVEPMGRADFAFYPIMPNDTAFIIELKKDKTPEEAIEQIKDRKYFIPFKNFKGRKLLIGITYDTKTEKHNVKIEELE